MKFLKWSLCFLLMGSVTVLHAQIATIKKAAELCSSEKTTVQEQGFILLATSTESLKLDTEGMVESVRILAIGYHPSSGGEDIAGVENLKKKVLRHIVKDGKSDPLVIEKLVELAKDKSLDKYFRNYVIEQLSLTSVDSKQLESLRVE